MMKRLALFLLCLCAGTQSQAAEQSIGQPCKTGTSATDWDTIARCVGTTYSRSPYWFAPTTETCDSGHAGKVAWSGTSPLYCDGTAWVDWSGNLGASITNTNPSRSISEKNTGLYSPATGAIGFVSSGVEVMRIDSAANIGIGTTAPVTKVDVAGGVKIGAEGTCTAAKAGTIQWSGAAFQICDGTSWYTPCPIFTSSNRAYTSSGTFTPPGGVSSLCPITIRVLLVGGGGIGGIDWCGPVGGAGGGGSGYVVTRTMTLTSDAPLTVVVGTGGYDGAGNGIASSFNGVAAGGGYAAADEVSGGGGGGGGSAGGNGSSGTGSSGWYNGYGGQGYPIVSSSTTVLGITFSQATFGAGSGGGAGAGAGGGAGGICINGSCPQAQSSTGAGGTGYGAGGGGGDYCGTVRASGYSGLVYIEW